MTQIDLTRIGDDAWGVAIHEGQGGDTTNHRMVVDPESLTTLGVTDEELLVREAVKVYLDHDPGTALPHDVSLDWLEHNVDGFLDELAARLS